MSANIPVFDISSEGDLGRLTKDVRTAYANHSAAVVAPQDASDDVEDLVTTSQAIELGKFEGLIGISDSVYRQIQSALRSGKRHLMFYGPPGTGKTEIARKLAIMLSPKWRLITGSSDWSSQDIIGGYQPVGDNKIEFIPGILLQEFDRPLIIDELNRCDIDKVIGPLFTVLSGQASTLPYRTAISDKNSPQYVILPQHKPGKAAHEFSPTDAWRIIATINSIDKASLYQMSYALTRRFGWIYVDAPADLTGFLVAFLQQQNLLKSEPTDYVPALIGIWKAINAVRPIGPAPIIDIINTMVAAVPGIDFLTPPNEESKQIYLDGFYMYLLPMLDGILQQDADQIFGACVQAIALEPDGPDGVILSNRLRGMAV